MLEKINLSKAKYQRNINQVFTINLLYLLISLIGVYLPLQLFEIMAATVWQNENPFPWDVPILLTIHQTAQPKLDIFVVILTHIGSPKTLIPASLLIALLLALKKNWRTCIFVLFTSIGSSAINLAAKDAIHRVRPHLWESTYHKVGLSFPSGHAMASMTFIMILIVLLWKTRWRLPILIFGSIFVPIIALTRLYLGVHYPSDILGAWLLSLPWIVTTYMLIKPHRSGTNLINEINQ